MEGGDRGAEVPDGFAVVDHEVVHDGYLAVHRDTVRMPDGGEAVREYALDADAVAVVPVTDDGEVLLLRQYRHPHRRHLLEIPAGKLDEAGETPEEAGRRELREETGHDAGRTVHLTTFENSAGWTTEVTHVLLGTHLRREDADGFEATGEEADMELVRVPLTDALADVRAGRITDAKTVIGLLLAADELGLSSG